MKKCILCLALLAPIAPTVAVNLPDDFKSIYTIAEAYLINENYNGALPHYLKLEEMKMANANIDFKIGLCYQNASTNKSKAIPYFLAALKNITTGKYKEGDLKEEHAPLST